MPQIITDHHNTRQTVFTAVGDPTQTWGNKFHTERSNPSWVCEETVLTAKPPCCPTAPARKTRLNYLPNLVISHYISVINTGGPDNPASGSRLKPQSAYLYETGEVGGMERKGMLTGRSRPLHPHPHCLLVNRLPL